MNDRATLWGPTNWVRGLQGLCPRTQFVCILPLVQLNSAVIYLVAHGLGSWNKIEVSIVYTLKDWVDWDGLNYGDCPVSINILKILAL